MTALREFPDQDDVPEQSSKQSASTEAPHSAVQATVPGKDWHHLVDAADDVVTRIATRIAKRKFPPHLRDDVLSVARCAVVEAASKWTESKADFLTYIPGRVRGAILDYMRKSDILTRTARRTQKQIEYLQQRSPGISDEVIARELGVLIETVEYVHYMTGCKIYPLDNSEYWGDRLVDKGNSPEDTLLQREEEGLVNLALVSLTQQERTAYGLYYQGELTQREIAEKMNVTDPRISQLLSQARGKITTWLAKNTH